MCGIVGYVGEQSALDVVIDGLRRLEYRGYDSAGVARARRGAAVRQEGRQARQPARRPSAEHPLAASTTGIGHTRWATHGAPTDRNAHPHLGCTRPGRGHPQRHHRELRRSCGRARGATGDECAPTPTPRSVAHLLEPSSSAAAATWPRPCGASAGGSRAPSPWSPSTPRTPASWWAPAATPRSSSAWATGENFLASDVAAFIEHTREAIELGQDQVVEHHAATGVEVTDFDGKPAEGTRVPRRLGRLGRREGRLRLLHAQGDRRAAAGRRRHAARPARRRRPAAARRDAALRPRAARGRQDHHHRVRHGVPRRAGREVRHRALDPHPVRGRAGHEFRYRDPILTRSRWSSRSASPARPWTP